MLAQTVGFIGAGRAARIILEGWKRAGSMPSGVVLYDCEKKACETLMRLGSEVKAAASAADAAAQQVVFLAVHPPAMKEAVEAAKAHVQRDAIVISLAPKFTLATLTNLLGGFNRVARLIPNAPSIVCRGFNPLAFGEALTASDRRTLEHMFQPLGECPEVDEDQLEAYAILSAMGPTYFWPQLYALESLGETFGLTSEATLEALDKMLWGTMATIRESGLSPEQVQDLIPVKPMAEEVQALCNAYGRKLQGLMQKIKP